MADTNVLRDSTAAYTGHGVIAANFVDAVARTDSEAANYAIAAVPDEIINGGLVELNKAANGETYWTDTGILARFGGAPATGYNAQADDFALGAGSGAVGQSFYPGDSDPFTLAVRSSTLARDGYLQYSISGSIWLLGCGNSSVLRVDPNEVSPAFTGTIASGQDGRRWTSGFFADALYVANAPNSGWNANADDLLVGNGSGARGMTIYSGNANTGVIAFGDADDTDQALLQYNHNVDKFLATIGGATTIEWNTGTFRTTTGLNLGDNNNRWGDMFASGTAFVADAPNTGWNTGADDVCIGDGTGDSGVSVYAGASGLGQFVVRTPAGGYIGALRYDVSDERWEIAAEGSTQLYIGNGYFSPDQAAGSTLGTASLPFGNLPVFTSQKTANYTATAGQRVPYDASGGTFTLTAPASPSQGQRWAAKEIANDATAVTVSGNGNNIESPVGATPASTVGGSFTIGVAYVSLEWEFDGAVWRIV